MNGQTLHKKSTTLIIKIRREYQMFKITCYISKFYSNKINYNKIYNF
jgi:hypothetical protein